VRLIVGLGNPGKKYSHSRHNVGFLVLESLAKRFNIDIHRKKFDSLMGKGIVSDCPVVLVKPQTFMNLSGVAVEKYARFFTVHMEEVIVVHDDLDLPFNDIRIKMGGGDGGHKGLRSMIDRLGGSDFVRVRLGIDKPDRKEMVERYVLERFSEDEMKMLPHLITRACDAVGEILLSGTQTAMNKFNVRGTQNSSKEV
jgi:PTH1 family peptidyl-tRNA hydrolase